VLEWLINLTEGGADALEVDMCNNSIWNKLRDFIYYTKFNAVARADADLSSLLRVMSLLSGADPTFRMEGDGTKHPFLKPHDALIVTQGQRLRAQLPAYLEQQHALIAHHAPLPAVLQPLIGAYARPTRDEMWSTGLPVSTDECSSLGCGSEGLKRCQRCKQVRYCNRQCQLAHWKAHKVDCKRGSAELEGKEGESKAE
jgi:hypothetical protein